MSLHGFTHFHLKVHVLDTMEDSDDKYSESEDDGVRYMLGASDENLDSSDEEDAFIDDDENDGGGEEFGAGSRSVTKGSDESDELDDEENDETDDNDLITHVSDDEMWSGTSFEPDSFQFDGNLCLSDDISFHFPR